MAIPAGFLRICRANSRSIDQQAERLLEHYVELLLDWNSKINLISRRDEENVWYAHILHSISPLFLVEIPANSKIIDLGSGGGLPGIPLAILRPDLRMALLDSIRKKTTALEGIVGELGLTNVNIVTGRAEEVCRWEGLAGAFDIVVSRAVAPLKDLVKWSRPFLVSRPFSPPQQSSAALSVRRPLSRPCLMALKGGELEAEVRQASLKAGAGNIEVIRLAHPGSEELGLVEKHIVVVSF